MPKGGGGGGGGKGKNKPPPSAGRVHRLNYNSPQAAGLQVLWSTIPFHGRAKIVELAHYQQDNPSNNPSQQTWVRHPELGSMIDFAPQAWREIEHQRWMNVTNQLTVSAWVYSTDFGTYRAILNKSDGNGAGNAEYMLRVESGSLPTFFVSDGGTWTTIGSGTAISTETLYHICGVLGPDDTMKIYVNGVLKNSGAGPGANLNQTAGEFWIGRYHDTASYAWSGYIGEVRMYNRALSPIEVWKLWDPASRFDIYNFAGYGSSGPGDLPLPPPPPPENGGGAGKDVQTQRTGAPFWRF